jgi:hypothetical protein
VTHAARRKSRLGWTEGHHKEPTPLSSHPQRPHGGIETTTAHPLIEGRAVSEGEMPGSKAVRERIEQLLCQISLLSLDDYPNQTAWLTAVLPPL